MSGKVDMIAKVTIPLAMLLVTIVASVEAAPPLRHKAMSELRLLEFNDRLMVVGATTARGPIGLRAGDEIVAVNGRSVSTEAALMNHLSMTSLSTQAISITVARNGRSQFINVPVNRSSSVNRSRFVNLNLLVMTAQGVMHMERAIRLGIPYTELDARRR